MKKYLLMLAFGLAAAFAQAQKSNHSVIIDPIEEQPEFTGGVETILQYLSQNIRLPEEVKRGKVQGKVFVHFLIDEQGNIKNPKVVKGLSKACDEEALRLVRQMPRWKPGKQNGRAVLVKYVLPISFARKAK